MKPHVCPWWIGYFLASPIRKLTYDPRAILAPYVREGMTVLEIGPGIGFFSLPLARMAGPKGCVVCVELQERMLSSLRRRAAKADLAERMEFHLCSTASLGIADLANRADFALAFAMVHEVPDADRLLNEVYAALRPGAACLISEPKGHVTAEEFEKTLAIACAAGFVLTSRPSIRQSHSILLTKP